uniref:Uncharacterized protein n=1 Tax=Arundo donax TaxID=35708 RepID=A0A0A9FD48_ARUDO
MVIISIYTDVHLYTYTSECTYQATGKPCSCRLLYITLHSSDDNLLFITKRISDDNLLCILQVLIYIYMSHLEVELKQTLHLQVKLLCILVPDQVTKLISIR